MTQPRWSAQAPGHPQGFSLGEEGLETFGFYTERFWIWVGELLVANTSGAAACVVGLLPVHAWLPACKGMHLGHNTVKGFS